MCFSSKWLWNERNGRRPNVEKQQDAPSQMAAPCNNATIPSQQKKSSKNSQTLALLNKFLSSSSSSSFTCSFQLPFVHLIGSNWIVTALTPTTTIFCDNYCWIINIFWCDIDQLNHVLIHALYAISEINCIIHFSLTLKQKKAFTVRLSSNISYIKMLKHPKDE